MSDLMERTGKFAGASTPCPGLEPGLRNASTSGNGSERRALAIDPIRLWVPALRPGHEGGVSRASRLAAHAVAALVAEAELSPKPGLVDARGAGAHADVELHSFIASAHALRETFERMALAGEGAAPSQELRERLAAIGRDGEVAMFAATGGANTHRGAIFALGLVITAAAACGEGAFAENICATAGVIARFDDRFSPPVNFNGARACRRYGVTGARGEAKAGFPHVLKALSALKAARTSGAGETASRLDSLLTVMASLDDTCLLHRGGVLALRVARFGARAALRAGGAGTEAGMAALIALDRRLLALNASPGGAADMLAAALFLDRLTSANETPSFQNLARHGPARPDHPRPASSSTPEVGPPVKPEDDDEAGLEADPGSARRAVRDDAMATEA